MLTRVASPLSAEIEDVMRRIIGAAIEVIYKGRSVQDYRLDLVVESRVIVEVKAVSHLDPIHSSQVVSCLKATGLRAGLLLNFNSVVMKNGIRRIVL